MTILNAKDRKLEDLGSGLPDVGYSVMQFLQTVKIGIIEKQQINGYTQEIINYIKTQAARQPLSAQELAIKAEGERSWKWEKIHTTPEVKLSTDDRIVFKGIPYRVMEKFDYTEYGFLEYHVVEDFRHSIRG